MAAPLDVAVRANGNYLVVAGADTSSFVRELTPEGEIVREWVPAAPGENGIKDAVSVVETPDGTIVVAYHVANRLLRFSSTGQFIEEIADAEDPFGWDGLYDVVVDPGNNLSIVEWFGHRVTTVDQQGTFLRSIGSSGFQPGQFNFSRGLTYDAAGRLVVADFSNKRIQVFEDATLVQALGTAMDGPFGTPYAVAADASGGVYVTDWGMSRIHMLVDPDLVPAPEVVRKPRLS